MFTKTTRSEILAEAVPDALVEDYFAGRRTRSIGLDLELSGRHRDRTEFSAKISLSHIDTGDVLLDQGGA